MKHQLKLLAAAGLVAVATSTLQAQPYYVAGDWQGWDPAASPMTDNGDGSYYLTASGFTPGGSLQFKITPGSWSTSWPSDNVSSLFDANGNFTFRWYPGVQNDGWTPLQNRVGYDDPQQFGWDVIGSFNGWSAPVVTLTNTGPGLYEGAYAVPTAGNYEFKFRKQGDWAISVGAGFGQGNISLTTTDANQLVTFRLDLPKGRYLTGDPAPAATNHVTFLVNMEVPISEYPALSGFDTNSGGDHLYVRGDFNGWTASAPYELFPVAPGSTLYSNKVDVVAYSGATMNYKFFGDAFPGEESPLLTCGAARTVQINSTDVAAPPAYWSDRQLSDPTNKITFQVDMAVQIATGSFDPNTDSVYLRGTVNNWGNAPESPLLLTNLPAPNTNIYAGVVAVTNWPIGACVEYKFWNGHAGAPNSGYESINNRQFNLASSTVVLATVPFNNVDICDVIEQTNYITFSVNMTNAVGTYLDSTVYDGSQNVYLNGDFAGWWGWGDTNNAATNYLMSKAGDIYSLTVPIPPGNVLRLQYKYSMNGVDDEAQSGQDHVRYIRTLPGQTSYSLPLDNWTGTSASNIAKLKEPMIGYVNVTPGVPGQVNLQWLGLKCAGLQATTNLTSSWTAYPATEGQNSTNLPISGDSKFFRVARPITP